MTNKKTWSEFGFIADLLAPLSGEGALHLSDDAAQISPPAGFDLVVSADALVEGVHFPLDKNAALVARRALACNISDLAAKGAKPYGCMLTLGVAPHWGEAWLGAFAEAFGAGLTQWGMPLWGGDTVSSATGFINLTVHGLVPHGQMIKRSGAQIGDDVYLTGTIGDGYLGLKHMSAPYTDPRPPLAFGQGLVGLAHAALDVSDGLLADLDHIARASACMIELEAGAMPLSNEGKAFLKQGGTLETLLSGGDDLQIAFTAAPQNAATLIDLARQTDIALSRIGSVVASQNEQTHAVLHMEDGEIISPTERGFRHF